MPPMIEYKKIFTEIVYINLPGPTVPEPGMSGAELVHGFLAELYRSPNPDVKAYIDALCKKWNIHYREKR